MTKKELLVKYLEMLNAKKDENAPKITKKSSEFYGETFLETLMDAVAEGDLNIVGFGKFEKKFKEGKTGTINVGPKKGEEFTSLDHYVIGFKAGKVFKDKVNGIVVSEDEKEVIDE